MNNQWQHQARNKIETNINSCLRMYLFVNALEKHNCTFLSNHCFRAVLRESVRYDNSIDDQWWAWAHFPWHKDRGVSSGSSSTTAIQCGLWTVIPSEWQISSSQSLQKRIIRPMSQQKNGERNNTWLIAWYVNCYVDTINQYIVWSRKTHGWSLHYMYWIWKRWHAFSLTETEAKAISDVRFMMSHMR